MTHPRILGGRAHTIKKDAESLVVVSKESGLEVNAAKTESIWSRFVSECNSHSISTNRIYFERAEDFRYLGTTLTHRSSIQEEIRSR